MSNLNINHRLLTSFAVLFEAGAHKGIIGFLQIRVKSVPDCVVILTIPEDNEIKERLEVKVSPDVCTELTSAAGR